MQFPDDFDAAARRFIIIAALIVGARRARLIAAFVWLDVRGI
jgi:hypothetical protein